MGGDRDLKTSLAFYASLVLFVGQFGANIAGVPFHPLFLSITGAILLGVLFGPNFAIDFFRAVRGTRKSDDGSRKDA